jgi:hypothetical protein
VSISSTCEFELCGEPILKAIPEVVGTNKPTFLVDCNSHQHARYQQQEVCEPVSARHLALGACIAPGDVAFSAQAAKHAAATTRTCNGTAMCVNVAVGALIELRSSLQLLAVHILVLQSVIFARNGVGAGAAIMPIPVESGEGGRERTGVVQH